MRAKRTQFPEVGSLGKMGKALGHSEPVDVKHFRVVPHKEPQEGTNEEFITEMGGPEALIEHRHGKM